MTDFDPTPSSNNSDPVSDGGAATGSMSPGTCMQPPPSTPADIINAIVSQHRKRDSMIRTEGDITRRMRSACVLAAGGLHKGLEAKEAKRRKTLAAEAFGYIVATEMETLAAAEAERTGKKRRGAPKDIAAVSEEAMAVAELAHGDVAGILPGRVVIEANRKIAEKRMEELAKQTHVAGFVDAHRGFGWIGLAQIIGSAGDLGAYANPAKLWKRMGLGLIGNGQRQQRFTDVDKAAEAGYSPRRRSTMYVIGDSLLKSQIRKDEADPDKRIALGDFGRVYLERKAYEEAKPAPAAPAKPVPKAANHMRAQRYMEKRLLRNLWRAWRGQVGDPVTP